MFLATTAVQEFWNKDEKILFLGEWCKLYSEKETWGKLDYVDLPFIWQDNKELEKAILYCDDVYERCLVELTSILNDIHSNSKDVKYYRIILGNWLIHFIHQAYDKYCTLNYALDTGDEIFTYLLDNSQNYFPVDYIDYQSSIIDDKYNLQLYSQILNAMGFNFPGKKISDPLKQKNTIPQRNKKSVTDFIFKLLSIYSNFKYSHHLTITSPYIFSNSFFNILKILFKSRLRFLSDDMPYGVDINFKIDIKKRKEFKLKLNNTEFENILSNILFFNIPALFLEGYKEFRTKVLTLPIKKSRVYVTSNALHGNNIFKFFTGENYTSIKLLAMQHGAGYGMEKLCLPEKYERSICDIFYSWGWADDGNSECLPPALKKNKQYKKSLNDKRIIFVQTSQPRNIYRLHFNQRSSTIIYNYLEGTIRFLKLINERTNLIIRPYIVDYNWKLKDRLIEQGILFEFDDFRKSFLHRAKESAICVCDHFGTSTLFTLATNKPTIIFIDKKIFEFRSPALSYLEALETAKILHYTPESAATHLNNIYDNVSGWWDDENVQIARKEFIFSYMRLENEWIKSWVNEFSRILSI